MPTTRTCCCTVTELGKPLLVRAGWYHFLVLTESGGVSCLIGDPTRTRHDNESCYIPYLYGGAPGAPVFEPDLSWCTEAAVPIEAPAGHPLHVPTGVKSSFRNGSAIKDITCGAYHNLVRTEDNRIIAWGLNAMGQCNVPTTLADGTHPKAARIVGLHAGYSTSAVTFNDGSVLAWGDPVVCDVVNTWTNLMMSPINNQVDGNGYNSTDNVATDNPKFAKPYYQAAYSTSVSETWNLLQDPTSKWHGGSAPHSRWSLNPDEHACVPFFDLGVETDPANPLEFGIVEESVPGDYMDSVFPGIGVANPLNWNDLTEPPCYNEAGCLTHPEQFGDWLSMLWRNHRFKTGLGRKSCCDLKIKRDFAVGLKRTGQVITCRPTDGSGMNPNRNTTHCPTAATNSCRDCSADKFQTLYEPTRASYQSSCTSPLFYQGKTGEQIPDGAIVAQAGCSCVASITGGGTEPDGYSVYMKTGCPQNCPICEADRRFVIDVNCGSETSFKFFEGIGCISASPRGEEAYYDPNWARNFQSGTMSSAMYSPGEQVRYVDGGPYIPSINGPNVQENWGWTTKPTGDILQTGATDCVSQHTASTLAGSLYCHPEKTVTGTTACPTGDMSKTCKAICKSSQADEYAHVPLEPQGTAMWQYPVQFFSNGVLAGTNTTVWTSVPRLLKEFWKGACATCNTVNLGNCYDSMWQKQDITQGASGGLVTYGCLYPGPLYTGGGTTACSVDKYNQTNSYSYPVNSASNVPSPCRTFADKLNAAWMLKAPSKPWGPFSFVMTNGFGEKSMSGLLPCHCSNPDDLNEPSEYCSGIGLYDPPNLLRIVGANTDFIDRLLATFQGFPREANLSCRLAPWYGRYLRPNDGSFAPYGTCNASCGSRGSHWAQIGHGQIPAFCIHNPFISYASGRLSFAVVRADHRNRDDTGARIKPDLTHSYPPRKINGQLVASDPLATNNHVDLSQHPGCTCTEESTHDSCTPYVTGEWSVHVWGSLWDPCPPWPRLCNNTNVPEPQPGVGCATEWLGDVELETEDSSGEPLASPEMNWTPADELDPLTAKGYGSCALYPPWTRLPTNPSPGDLPLRFSSKRGSWQKDGVWSWVTAEDAPCEPSVGSTMYCPNCAAWTLNYTPLRSENPWAAVPCD